MIKLSVFSDGAALTEGAVRLLRSHFFERRESPFAVMLAGGSTPMAAYARIADDPPAPAPRLHVVFSDDRHVPPDSPKSNYGQTRDLIRALGLPDERVIRVRGEEPLDRAAAAFDADFARFVESGGVLPVGLLGLGADGHTASLFSQAHIEQARGRFAIAVERPDGMNGVSLTPDAIARVQRLIFLVAGVDKRTMLGRLLKDPMSIPAGLATANCPALEVWCDAAANPL